MEVSFILTFELLNFLISELLNFLNLGTLENL